MKHGSLFSGIGGFDLAAEWMGWENIFHCEWNEFGQKVLKYYWPSAISYGDITKTDFTIWRGKIDIVTGGFPCQPFSAAGKRKGKEDNRYLWPEMLRAVREIQPAFVVAENVHGIINQGRGLVFEQVQADLENEGYEVQSYLLPACAKSAPHRRDRFWFVSRLIPNPGSNGQQFTTQFEKRGNSNGSRVSFNEFNALHGAEFTTNPNRGIGCERWLHHQTERKEAKRYAGSFNALSYERNTWDNFPTQPPICSRNDGLSPELAGITVSKHRTESIKGYGNAIVPQVAYEIFKAIEQCDNNVILAEYDKQLNATIIQ